MKLAMAKKSTALVSGHRDFWMRILLCIAKVEGDSTSIGQRPLCVLLVVYRLWASVRLAHLREWFSSWVPDSVFSAGKGVSSVDAWYATSIDIEEVLSHARHSDFHYLRC